MTQLSNDARLPQSDDQRQLKIRIHEITRATSDQVNALSEGRMVATNNATTAIPTTGTYAVGDFVRNSAPVELGTIGSKYILIGWTCVTAPLTFVQTRCLTGN